MGISISGTGCALLDLIYTDIDLTSQRLGCYLSRNPGDGGLVPGGAVFSDDLQRFAGESLAKIVATITNGGACTALNLGGPALAAMVNTAQLCHDRDVVVRFYGKHGNDPEGRQIREILGQTDVDIAAYQMMPGTSPYTIVFSHPDDGHRQEERSFVTHLGVADEFSADDLPPDFFDAEILFFGGTALVPGLHDQLGTILLRGSLKGCIKVVATVYDFRSEKYAPGKPWPLCAQKEQLSYIDLLVMNREEALRISAEKDIQRALHWFSKAGVHSVIVTHGSLPIRIYSDGSLFECEGMYTMPTSEELKQDIRESAGLTGDTTGCGDNFVGGILASIATQLEMKAGGQLDLTEACAWGICSGAFACSYNGGVYHEKDPGEKYDRIKPYVQQYLTRMANNRTRC